MRKRSLAVPVPVAQGGTGAITAAAARTALGLGTVAVENLPLSVAKGGTAATDADGARTALSAASATHTHPQSDVTDLTTDLAAKAAKTGLKFYIKDAAGTPHYWQITISDLGVLTTADAGTSLPTDGIVVVP